MSITTSGPNHPKHSSILPIQRSVPGSNIKVMFVIPDNQYQNAVVQAIVCIGNQTKHIESISIDSLLNHQSTASSPTMNDVIQKLKESAIDYISEKIIFLPQSPTSLFNQWQQQRDPPVTKKKINKLAKEVGVLQDLEKTQNVTLESVTAYLRLGYAYFKASCYKDALLCYQKMFSDAKKIDDKEGLRLAHRSLGLVYSKLGEIERAIQHHVEDLYIARTCFPFDNIIKGEALCNLGNIYADIGKFGEAFSYHEQYLDIIFALKQMGSEDIDDKAIANAYSNLGDVYQGASHYAKAEEFFQNSLGLIETPPALNGLGLVYRKQGKYKQAIEKFKKTLELTNNLANQGDILNNLGLSYKDLGRDSEAKEYFLKDLKIAEMTKAPAPKARALYHLGMAEIVLGGDKEGIKKILEAMRIAEHIQDQELKGMIYGGIGHVYYKAGRKDEAIAYFNKHLENAKQLNNLEGQYITYKDLGDTYFVLSHDYEKAIEQYQEGQKIAQQANNREGLADAYHNLGRSYQCLKEYEKAIYNFRESIKLYSELLEQNCKENIQWQVSLFESQYRPYRYLEKVLKETNINEALLTADYSRSRSLVSLLGQKLNIPDQQKLSLSQVQEVAARLQTFIVIYTCDPLEETKAWCWIVSPNQSITHHELDLTSVSKSVAAFSDDHEISRGRLVSDKGEKLQKDVSYCIATIEEGEYRGGAENDPIGTNQESFQQLLKDGYQALIAPIVSLLPQNGERVTIIPDAFLHDLPFAIFQDLSEKYLFEKCTLITAPSIEALLRIEMLNNKNKPTRNLSNISVVTNATPSPEYGLPELKGAKKEGEAIAQLFRQEASSGSPLSITDTKKYVGENGFIHFACHGLASEKESEYSVFEGALVMPDRLLYTEDIRALSLNADLAFLSACHSGQGKVYREGSVGLPFAFLAAGASSVIATRWKIRDSATQEIVQKFYQHYLGDSEQAKQALLAKKPFGQAEALREAMIFAKQKWPDKPHIWGAFFLAGLPGHIENTKPTNIREMTWIDAGRQFHFSLDNGKVAAKFSKKSNGKYIESKVFDESNIRLHTVPMAKVRTGTPQVSKYLHQLMQAEKAELIQSLRQKEIDISGEQLIIYQKF